MARRSEDICWNWGSSRSRASVSSWNRLIAGPPCAPLSRLNTSQRPPRPLADGAADHTKYSSMNGLSMKLSVSTGAMKSGSGGSMRACGTPSSTLMCGRFSDSSTVLATLSAVSLLSWRNTTAEVASRSERDRYWK